MVIVFPRENKLATGIAAFILLILCMIARRKPGDNFWSIKDWTYKHVYVDDDDKKYSINTFQREYKASVYDGYGSRKSFCKLAANKKDNKDKAYLVPGEHADIYHFYALDGSGKIKSHKRLAKYRVVDLTDDMQRQQTERHIFKTIKVQPKEITKLSSVEKVEEE